jgi:ABC-2 type transport system permease protein
MLSRYLRVLGLFWSTSIASEMEYRTNFLLTAVSSLGSLAGSIFAMTLFYQHGGSLGGWPWHEALLVLGLFTVLQGLSRMLLNANLSRIVEHVRRGTLDFVLLKPIDSQFWLSTRRLSPWGLPDLVFGVSVLAYSGHVLSLSFTHLVLAVVPIVLSITILYSLWYIIASTTIWYVKIYNVTEVLQSLLAAGRFPIDAFPPGLYRFVFSFIVPVAFLTTVPARAMLGRAGYQSLLAATAFAVGLFVFSRVFWRFALRSYSSASS